MFSNRVVGFLGVVLLFVAVSNAQVATGTPPHSTLVSKGADIINLGNNNVFLNIPIISKQGRGAPFSYSISLNSSIWYPLQSGSSKTWQPMTFDGSALGWQGINPQASSGASYAESVSTGQCENSNNTGTVPFAIYTFKPVGFLAAMGTFHAFSGNTLVYYYNAGGSAHCPPNGVGGAGSTTTLSTSDGSGYSGIMTLQGTGANPSVSFQVKDAKGNSISAPATPSQNGGYAGALTTTDANGNQVTENAGQYTDTTGSSVLNVVYQAANSGPPDPDGKVITEPAKTTLQYNIPGGTASFQVIYSTYTVATNFDCPNSTMTNENYGPVSTNLVSQILTPDGGTYSFGYEATQGLSGSVTGRIASITLPTGGSIAYQYSGGSEGINCTDGSTPTLTRTSADGISTFVLAQNNNGNNTNTVTDEKGNQSVYTFAGLYEMDRKIYQGSAGGTPLEEVATSVAEGNYIVTEVDSTTTYNGGSPLLTKTTYDSTGVVVTNVAQYSGSSLLENTAYSYTIAPPLYNLNSTTTTDSSGTAVVALTQYTYDGGTLTPTSSLPQHTSVSGARGNLTSTQVSIDGSASNNLTTSTVYYDTGQPQTTTTPSGTTTYNYEPTNTFVTGTTMPAMSGNTPLSTGGTYDVASGALLTSTGMSGQKSTVTQYDNVLRPQTVIPVSGSQYQISIIQTPSQNPAVPSQSTTSQVNTNGSTSTSTTLYDSYGRTSRIATYNGQTNAATAYYQTDYCYDAAGLLSFQSLPYAGPGFGPQANSPKQCSGAGTTYQYDALGRTLQTQTANGSTTDGPASAVYTNRAVKTTDVNGAQKIIQYDLLGRISGICEISAGTNVVASGSPVACGMDIAGTGFVTTYAYNLATHTTTITQGAQTRIFQTDAAGRTVYTSEPERGVTRYAYTYNTIGLKVTRTRALANQPMPAPVNGVTPPPTTTNTDTQYDALGRTVSVTYYDGTPNKQFSYDQASTNGGTAYNNGQMTNASTQSASGTVTSTQMNYGILGNVSDTSQCMPNQCGNANFNVLRYYAYDPVLSTRTQESYLTGGSTGTRVDTNMAYTVAGELLTMANTLTGAANDNGAIVSVASAQNSVFGPTGYTLGNGLSGVQTYDGVGRSSGITLCVSTASNCTGLNMPYQMTQSVAGGRVTAMNDTVLGTNATPSYDEFNRLSGISYGTRQQAFSYVYDRYGNRWQQNILQGSGPSPQLSFNANNQIASAGYSYDAAGNMTSDGPHSYTYDAEGNVTQVDGGSTATYIYDAFNHRVRITTPTADTYYTFNTDGVRVASWNAASTSPTMLAAYTYWGGAPIATYTGAGVTFAHQDLLGTKRLTTTSTGSVAGSYQSLPFGDSFTIANADADPSHFALLDHDTESSTEHAQFRQYSSTPGTWMSPDPYDGSYDSSNPQSLNRYAYVLNNPLVSTDPSGQDSCGDNNDVPGYYACKQAAADAAYQAWLDAQRLLNFTLSWLYGLGLQGQALFSLPSIDTSGASGGAPSSSPKSCSTAPLAGNATYYNLTGSKTASGATFNPNTMNAAMFQPGVIHLGQTVTVTLQSNPGQSITVVINDTGPFAVGPNGRALSPPTPNAQNIIDLTPAAFIKLNGSLQAGKVPVIVTPHCP